MISARPILARAGIDRNPLRRKIDRTEAWTSLGLLLLLLIVVPVAAWYAGWESYRHGSQAERIEQSTRQQVTARLVSASSYQSLPSGTLLRPVAQATWAAPDGTARTGLVRVASTAHSGSTEQIWTDAAGNVVTAPRRHAETLADTAFSAALTALSVFTALLVIHTVIHYRLDHRRYRQWEQEWEQVGPQWSRSR